VEYVQVLGIILYLIQDGQKAHIMTRKCGDVACVVPKHIVPVNTFALDAGKKVTTGHYFAQEKLLFKMLPVLYVE